MRKITCKNKASYGSSPPCIACLYAPSRHHRVTVFTIESRKGLAESAMGWLRVVGSLKLQVSFAKEPYKREDILQKRPIILRSLLIVATPYYVTSDRVTIVSLCAPSRQYRVTVCTIESRKELPVLTIASQMIASLWRHCIHYCVTIASLYAPSRYGRG